MATLNRMDREWLNAEIDHVVREIDSISKREVAEALIAKMKRAEADGDSGYMPIVWAMAENGIVKAVADRIRQEHDTVRVSTTGHVVSLPRFGSVKKRDESGLAIQHQMSLWQEMPRTEFDEMVAARIRRHDTEGIAIEKFVKMQKVWDQHPEARNVVEAIHRAGMSLEDFGIQLQETA